MAPSHPRPRSHPYLRLCSFPRPHPLANTDARKHLRLKPRPAIHTRPHLCALRLEPPEVRRIRRGPARDGDYRVRDLEKFQITMVAPKQSATQPTMVILS